jgi:molybdate transport system substrate-binding protein
VALKVLSTLAVQGALPALAARYEQATGEAIAIEFAPTNGLLARITAGETADIAVLTRSAIDDLAQRGVLLSDGIADIAISLVGIAVKAGAPKPEIGDIESLKATLLAAKSIAYSKIGASGVFFADLIQRLGIAEAVNAKATIIPTGLTGELAARGKTELAIQQLSELMLVAGVDIVGPLPPGAESVTTFSAGVFAAASVPRAARDCIRSLKSPDAARALVAAGLQPA